MTLAATMEEALHLHRQGRLRDAFERYKAILADHPDYAPALHYSGVVLLQSGDPGNAADLIRRAILIDQGPAEPWANLAQALTATGHPEAAINALKEAARRSPQQAGIWSNLAVAELELGRHGDAEASARQAVAADARHAPAWFNLALVLEPQGRILEALDAASRAAAIDPDDVAHAGLAAQLQEDLGRYAAARKTLDGALARRPTASALHGQQARVLEKMGDLPAAARALETVLRLKADDGPTLSQLIFLRKEMGDWHDLAALQARFRAGVAAGWPWLSPFSLLSDPSTRSEQRLAAERWSAQFVADQEPDRPPATISAARLRIGYLSSDYCEHPTAVLTAGLFEHHDRTRFEIVGYSTGPDDGSPLRSRVVAAFDHFVDASAWPPAALAARIRADAIDILVDLKGHTAGAPTAALALRPAPILAHYLGYPGTLGAAYVDYLIGDPVVTPFAHAPDYREALVQLPWSYQVNDRARAAAPAPSRDALGLAADAVVLCCFNSTWKLNPEVFAAWARILIARPAAVLWLLARGDDVPIAAPTRVSPPAQPGLRHPATANPATSDPATADPATANLRREMAARGVDPGRLAFAAHRPRADYLALYEHADLFLDTWPYNAHTTASDALWMGCPVVTWCGETFPARVGASLLAAVGLPGLIGADVDAYVDLAVALAGDPGARRKHREHLLGPGRASPLFDVARTTKALEVAYARMATDYRNGVRAPIRIDPADL